MSVHLKYGLCRDFLCIFCFLSSRNTKNQMSFLRWAGSKKQLLTVLSSCWYASNGGSLRATKRYIEGFSGSAALFFHIQPPKALLVDVNADLQQCFERVKSQPKGVALALAKFKCSETEYYRVRALDKTICSQNERAAIFIYLNRNCFNGLYRTNRNGVFNVPYGGNRSGVLPTYGDLLSASALLQNTNIICGDFAEILTKQVTRNDFVYLDPPYARRNVGLDNQYGPDVFGLKDIEKLRVLLESIHERGAHFLVSYANCDEVFALAKRWTSHRVDVRRTIAANAAKRGMAEELLITNL